MHTSTSGKILPKAIALLALGIAGAVGFTYYLSTSSIHKLLTENYALNQAITNLTTESQIGYATLQSQSNNVDGQLESKLRFVQTDPSNPQQIVSEQIFTVDGDIIHFDALIVKFTDEYVKTGKEKALFLWRRIYGENTPPAQGEAIEIPNTAPERYYAITKALRVKDRDVFWQAIWDLANDPAALSQYGVKAVFGNAIYTRILPNRVYTFKINPSGQIYIETFDAK
jgi:hypothetical protein